MTKVIKCTCNDTEQDKMYGKQNRVMNSMSKQGYYRCTVCKKETLSN